MKLNCELVQDLLPLYAEGMLKEGNRRLVEEHLEECESCRALLGELESPAVEVEHHADGLKGFRKKLRRHTFTVAAVTAFVVIFLALLVWSCFMSGSDALGYGLIAMYLVLPLAGLVCSLLLGLRRSKAKWIAPFAFALISGLLPLFVFGYTELGFFVFIFVIAMVGTLVGHGIYLVRNHKKRKAAA